MISQIPTPQRTNNKVIGEFYPLQKEELIALRKAKLINNTAFIHLALRYENPFCDRPVEIIPKEFALRWGIPESSVYEAIGKLKKLGVLLVKRGKVIIEWVVNSLSNSPVHYQQGQVNDNPEQLRDSRINSEPPEQLRDSRTNSEISESILGSQNNLRDSIINSEISENRGSKPASTGNSSSLQTYQTPQTIHTSQIAEEGEIRSTTNVFQKEVASTEVLLASGVNENSSFDQEKSSFPEESNSGGRSIVVTEGNQDGASSTIVSQDKLPQPKPYSPQKVNWRWLPEGPWNVEGKLDREFQEWLAKKWMAEYNRTDIYKAKADVLLHFKKDPTNLAVWWDVYQSQYIAKAKNIKTRLDHGLNISKEEQKEAIANHRAVLPMSEEQQQTTKQTPVSNPQLPTPQLKPSTPPLTPSQEGELKGVGWGAFSGAEAMA